MTRVPRSESRRCLPARIQPCPPTDGPHQPPTTTHLPLAPLPSPQVDNRHQAEPVVTPEQAVKLCDRNFGIGGDGVRVWQAGGRCLAGWLRAVPPQPVIPQMLGLLRGLCSC